MCGAPEQPKRKYMFRSEAREVKKRMERKTGQRYTFYPCPYCGFYHLGHAYTGSAEDRQRRVERWESSGTVRGM